MMKHAHAPGIVPAGVSKPVKPTLVDAHLPSEAHALVRHLPCIVCAADREYIMARKAWADMGGGALGPLSAARPGAALYAVTRCVGVCVDGVYCW